LSQASALSTVTTRSHLKSLELETDAFLLGDSKFASRNAATSLGLTPFLNAAGAAPITSIFPRNHGLGSISHTFSLLSVNPPALDEYTASMIFCPWNITRPRVASTAFEVRGFSTPTP